MIIGIDGASSDLSLALATADGELMADAAWSTDRRQSAELLPRLSDLLSRAGLRLADATALAVGLGPGSFTGLRVTLSLAKGLALALDRPIVGVASLPAWLEAEPGAVAAIARSGSREAYLFERGGSDVLVADRELLVERLADAPVVAPLELAEAFGMQVATRPHGAPAIAREAARRLAESGGDDLGRLEPIYLRAPRGVPTDTPGPLAWR